MDYGSASKFLIFGLGNVKGANHSREISLSFFHRR